LGILLPMLMNLLYISVGMLWILSIGMTIIYFKYNESGEYTEANVINSYIRTLLATLCLIIILFCMRALSSAGII